MCHYASRGWITYSLRGHPMILSMIPIVLPNDIRTVCTPYRQITLASILLLGFTLSSRSDIVRSSGSRLPTPTVARTVSSLAKSLNESTQDDPNRWNLHSAPLGDTVISSVRLEFLSVRSEADTTQSRARSPPLTRSIPYFQGNMHAS